MKKAFFSLFAVASLGLMTATPAHAIILFFQFDGNGGIGLLPTNVNGALAGTPGSGARTSFLALDTIANQMTLNMAWGSGNGFTDLTGNVTVAHIHYATANPAPAGFSENASTLVTLHALTGFNPSATTGGYSGTFSVPAAATTAIANEQAYVNIHTATNGGGEIRGHLVLDSVPEPSAAFLWMISGLGFISIFRKRHRRATR